MTITLNLPPETERTLLAQAKVRGVSLDTYLQSLIAAPASAFEQARPLRDLPPDGEKSDRSIDEIFDTVQLPPGVGQGAMHRENWYR